MRLPGQFREIAAICVATVLVVGPASPIHAEDQSAPVQYVHWRQAHEFRTGTVDGTTITPEGVRIDNPAGTITHTEPGLGTTRTYDQATWTSPWHTPGFDATELVASWNASTPPRTWLQAEIRGETGSAALTRWYSLGRWASGDSDIQRTSVEGQSDEFGSVNVDTFSVRPGVTLKRFQLRITLYRETGSSTSPTLTMAGAMTSAIPDRFDVSRSRPGPARGMELPVVRYSQNIHKGHFPQYGGGGEKWCSPTSSAMVLAYWGRRPTDDDLGWIEPGHPDPAVDYAARQTFDYGYDGTGNWPFNTAYAASFGLAAHVTRLHSLTDVEQYVRRGIPVITSQSFRAGELDGARFNTDGHIMVVIGFTPQGDVVANDPASASDEAVRNVYRRDQFERVWLRTKRYDEHGKIAGGSGGIAYIIAPR